MSEQPWRRFPVAINAEALALAWARQEAAPSGSVVVVDHEISPRGRLGRLWPHPAATTAVLAMVVRPALSVEQVDLVWLAGSLGVLGAAAQLGGGQLGLWWPEGLVGADDGPVGEVRVEAQLAPGRVASAVVTARLRLDVLGGADRVAAIEAMVGGLSDAFEGLGQDVERLRADYDAACALRGRRTTARLRPRGVLRGVARGVDERGRLELVSSTGLVERVPVDGLDALEVDPARTG